MTFSILSPLSFKDHNEAFVLVENINKSMYNTTNHGKN